jgi:hypothetical protein
MHSNKKYMPFDLYYFYGILYLNRELIKILITFKKKKKILRNWKKMISK